MGCCVSVTHPFCELNGRDPSAENCGHHLRWTLAKNPENRIRLGLELGILGLLQWAPGRRLSRSTTLYP
jgi:hypothetical protein